MAAKDGTGRRQTMTTGIMRAQLACGSTSLTVTHQGESGVAVEKG